MCLRHQSLPRSQRWVRILVDFAEEHMWEDTELAGDIWNGRWKRQDIEDILGPHAQEVIPPEELQTALQWFTELTMRLQKAQQTLYTARGSLIHARAKEMASIERRRHKARYPKSQTLYKVWKILYKRPPLRLRTPPTQLLCLGPPSVPVYQQIITKQQNWMHHPPPMRKATSKNETGRQMQRKCGPKARLGTKKPLPREDHRSQKLKLCRRRHV